MHYPFSFYVINHLPYHCDRFHLTATTQYLVSDAKYLNFLSYGMLKHNALLHKTMRTLLIIVRYRTLIELTIYIFR